MFVVPLDGKSKEERTIVNLPLVIACYGKKDRDDISYGIALASYAGSVKSKPFYLLTCNYQVNISSSASSYLLHSVEIVSSSMYRALARSCR